nr:hypothetical protein BDOA9_0205540 [Bradyrhizobium sp. DOA9]
MVRPISNDLRKRAVSAVAKGESCRSVAERFGVAVSSVVKWSQRYRATGSVAPGKMGGHRKPVLDPHRTFIVERITETPHLTLHGLKAELAARGVKVSHNAVWLFLRREGLRFKKKHCSPSNRLAPTSLVDASVGGPGRPGSIRAGSSSSMRPGSRPTWPLCGAGAPKEHVCAALLRMVTGGPSHSSVRSATTGSRHPVSSTDRSTASASALMSSTFSGRPCAKATSSFSTISEATNRKLSGRRSRPPAPGSGTCRPTHPTSIRSNRPSPRSNTGCGKLRSAPSRTLGATSVI